MRASFCFFFLFKLQTKQQRTFLRLSVWLITTKLTHTFFLNREREKKITLHFQKENKLECVQVNTHLQRTVYISEPMNLLIKNVRLVTQKRCIMHKYYDQKDIWKSKTKNIISNAQERRNGSAPTTGSSIQRWCRWLRASRTGCQQVDMRQCKCLSEAD